MTVIFIHFFKISLYKSIDLAVNEVKVTTGSSFIYIL